MLSILNQVVPRILPQDAFRIELMFTEGSWES